MAVNKVIYGNTTLVDLTSDTVTADNMAAGVRATGADGTKIVGLLPKVAIDNELSATSTNPVQNKVIKVALDGKLGKNDTAVNASKVNNLTVETAVPKNAKFTDTVYTHPSTHPASMISGLATVDTSGSYNDLTNKPTIPEQITVDSEISSTSTNPVQNKIVYEVLSAVRENLLTQINNLSAVAKSGSYNDLTDKPSNATTSSAGLMSAADKSKLDGISSDAGSVKMIVYS